MAATFRGVPLREVRNRWNRDRQPAERLRVTLLSTYTIDPLVPYLGVALRELDLPARLTVGPLNQIAQQCLDDSGETARGEPDVLVVAPRFEELWPSLPPPRGSGAADLTDLAEVALAAARRWRTCLVFVLPPLPDPPAVGVGDHACPAGLVATATAARERVRGLLGAADGVLLADAEPVVRAVGSRNAHHASLYEYARIPYTEEVFAGIADQVARLLRLRYAAPARALVLEADGLLLAPDENARPAAATTVGAALRELRGSGVSVAVRSNRPPREAEAGLSAALGPDWTDLVDDFLFDARPLREHVAEVAAGAELAVEEVAVMVGQPPPDELAPAAVLTLAAPAVSWSQSLLASGVFDSVPALPAADGATGHESPTLAGPAGASSPFALSLADYIASLNVSIAWRPARPEDAEKLAEMVLRTKDFALGPTYPEAELAAWIADESVEVVLGRVRDRLGDYGLGAAAVLRVDGRTARVPLFLVSCPALGKGVEEAALRKIRELAAARDCREITFHCRDTGRNGAALDFLRRHAGGGDGDGDARRLPTIVV